MKNLVSSLLFLCLFTSLFAQKAQLFYYLPQNVAYNPDIPRPDQVLGYQVGEWHVSHDQLSYYLRLLAERSERVEIEEMSQSHEGRKTFVLRISSVENQKNIELIKSAHRKLSDPKLAVGLDLEEMPAVAWLAYSIHGNEASGANAALLVAYYLAAAQSPAIDQLLSETVILIDPSMNPDGLNRFASWVNTHKGEVQVSDPNSREFGEAWPGGRTNHYWFDLNRDWLPGQHPETRGRLATFHDWKPNLLTDHHEMGSNSTFFFQPGIPSRNNPLTPPKVFELTGRLATFHAKALDRIGSLYYTQESFDDFYYGKSSTYPDVNGAVGVLFEQASPRGHARDTDNGLLTFPFAIRNQVTVSLSSLEGLLSMRTEFLEHQRSFFRNALRDGEQAEVKARVVSTASAPYRAGQFWAMLDRHEIEVYELEKDLEVGGKSFRAGEAMLIPSDQPQYYLIEALFERRTQFRDSLFYDVSAWTMPLAFGLEDAAIDGKAWRAALRGPRITAWPLPAGQVIGGQSRYAYAFSWEPYLAPRLLYALQQEGLRCKVATQPFVSAGGLNFDYGTILVPVARQPLSDVQLFDRLQALASETGMLVVSLKTGLTPRGVDLGSPTLASLNMPKVGLVVGEGVRSYEAGEVWHLMDQRYRVPVSQLPTGRLNRIDLSAYNVLVMVEGRYRSLGEPERDALRSWLQRGGVLVAWKGAANWLGQQGWAPWRFQRGMADSVTLFPYEEQGKIRGAQVIGGAIFKAKLDRSHPLAFGYRSDQIHLFRNSTLFMRANGSNTRYPLVYEADPLVAGFISDENLSKLGGSPGAGIHRMGKGRIVALTDNPNFRAFWYGTNKLFANAVFFGQIMN
jgi:hypothetical protein